MLYAHAAVLLSSVVHLYFALNFFHSIVPPINCKITFRVTGILLMFAFSIVLSSTLAYV
jgi:hypothetical protein